MAESCSLFFIYFFLEACSLKKKISEPLFCLYSKIHEWKEVLPYYEVIFPTLSLESTSDQLHCLWD